MKKNVLMNVSGISRVGKWIMRSSLPFTFKIIGLFLAYVPYFQKLKPDSGGN
jgi:hypothetical protein